MATSCWVFKKKEFMGAYLVAYGTGISGLKIRSCPMGRSSQQRSQAITRMAAPASTRRGSLNEPKSYAHCGRMQANCDLCAQPKMVLARQKCGTGRAYRNHRLSVHLICQASPNSRFQTEANLIARMSGMGQNQTNGGIAREVRTWG